MQTRTCPKALVKSIGIIIWKFMLQSCCCHSAPDIISGRRHKSSQNFQKLYWSAKPTTVCHSIIALLERCHEFLVEQEPALQKLIKSSPFVTANCQLCRIEHNWWKYSLAPQFNRSWVELANLQWVECYTCGVEIICKDNFPDSYKWPFTALFGSIK